MDPVEAAKTLLKMYTDMGVGAAVSTTPQKRRKKGEGVPLSSRVNVDNTIYGVVTPSVAKGGMSPHAAIASARDAVSQCVTLEDLKSAMESFEGCPLRHTATNTVFSDGNPKAPIMFIGEAPGADEDRDGIPFVGQSGKLLTNYMKAIGLNRPDDVYISNIVNWRPPGNRQPTPTEIEICRPFIEKHIELVNPPFLVFVGGVSTKALMKTDEGIMKVRGKWTTYHTAGGREIPCMATFHPAYLLRSPAQKALMWKDFLTLKLALAEKGLF